MGERCLLLGFNYEKKGVEKLQKGKLQKIEVKATPTMKAKTTHEVVGI